MNKQEHKERAREVIAAWNAHDVDGVAACYTENLVYREPGIRGEIVGAAAFRRYLSKLFEAWEMHWKIREVHPLADEDGAAVLWTASLAPRGSRATVTIDGMDIALLDGARVKRNEVYFDRAALAGLLAA